MMQNDLHLPDLDGTFRAKTRAERHYSQNVAEIAENAEVLWGKWISPRTS